MKYIMLKLKHHPSRIFPTIFPRQFSKLTSPHLSWHVPCLLLISSNTAVPLKKSIPKIFFSVNIGKCYTTNPHPPPNQKKKKKKTSAILLEHRKLILNLNGTLIGIIKLRHASHSIHFPGIKKREVIFVSHDNFSDLANIIFH